MLVEKQFTLGLSKKASTRKKHFSQFGILARTEMPGNDFTLNELDILCMYVYL